MLYDSGNLDLISAAKTLELSNEASILAGSTVFLATVSPQTTFLRVLATEAIIGPLVAAKVTAVAIAIKFS